MVDIPEEYQRRPDPYKTKELEVLAGISLDYWFFEHMLREYIG